LIHRTIYIQHNIFYVNNNHIKKYNEKVDFLLSYSANYGIFHDDLFLINSVLAYKTN
jgi:hypothetical protein